MVKLCDCLEVLMPFHKVMAYVVKSGAKDMTPINEVPMSAKDIMTNYDLCGLMVGCIGFSNDTFIVTCFKNHE